MLTQEAYSVVLDYTQEKTLFTKLKSNMVAPLDPKLKPIGSFVFNPIVYLTMHDL